jgi:adenylate kinase
MNYDQKLIKQIAEWLQAGSINIFGRPFAGKDTQGKRLADLFNAPLLGSGDLLRNSNNRIREQLRSGKLLPTADFLEVVLPHLSQEAFAHKPLVLSSVGRWHGEENSVMQATTAAGHPLKAIIYLDFPEEKVRQRWEAAQKEQDRGERNDDAAEVLETRLKEFRDKTLPVMEFYRQKNLLIEVNGDAPRDDVTAEILNRLAERARIS